jgi:hypothetical protein
MGAWAQHGVEFGSPPPHSAIRLSPVLLSWLGLNLQVLISTASAFSQYRQNEAADKPSITIMAHLDTGASKTAIDIKLADYLNLNVLGEETIHTAGGPHGVKTYAIDLQFPNTDLTGFMNLQINSCHLPFDIAANLNDPRNFGLLIGRDIMSRWNIVWNGPTSTVFIND